MIWLIGSLIYTAVALCGARLVAGHLAWTWRDAKHQREVDEWTTDRQRWPSITPKNPPQRPIAGPDGEQWFGAWCCALAIALVWPAVILPWLIGKRVSVGAERGAELERRERRIREMERELGIS